MSPRNAHSTPNSDPMGAEPRNPVGVLLRRWADDVGATDADAARILDVSAPTIHGYLTKTRLEMAPAMRVKIARMTRLPLAVVEAAAAQAAGYRCEDMPPGVYLTARMLAELSGDDQAEIAGMVQTRLRALRRPRRAPRR